MRYRITVAYDGTAYGGWQVQPGVMTIQERLEEVLEKLSGSRPKVHGSGRTDQGVHAVGQVAHFDLDVTWKPASLQKGLNALLPPDIRISACAETHSDFHARRSAAWKEYRYFIWNGPVLPPHLRLYRAHVLRPLNAELMQKAADHLVGRHDFSAFTANPNRVVESAVREVTRLDVRKKGSDLVLVVRGEGFLYKMVRSIAGILIRVGEGATPPADLVSIRDSRIRTARVPTAPPQGLFLWHVGY
ncbi:MAG: tRNA pseudouridine(38-40) synthase TruA [Kiritimatiellia bacterium]